MVRIPSVTGEEAAIAEYIARILEDIGFDVDEHMAEEGRPNVVGVMHGEEGSPKLILNGHMDTVPPGDFEKWNFDPYGGEISDGRLFGRGSCDMKGGLAAMMTAVKAIVDSGAQLRGDIIFTAVVDEEKGGYKGTKYIVDNGVLGDYALIAEPSQMDIHIAHKGDLGIEVTVYGKTAHAANPERGINAIHKMTDVINGILEIPQRFDWKNKKHRLVGTPTIGVSTIKGGIQRNIVPDTCSAVIDRRIVPTLESLEGARNEIEMQLDRLRNIDPQLDVKITKNILEVEACEISENEPVVKALKKAHVKLMEKEPDVKGILGFTDAHFLVNQGGVPTAMFGPGSIDQAHSENEYVEVKQLIKTSRIYAQTIVELLS